jgi:hypothetical protein
MSKCTRSLERASAHLQAAINAAPQGEAWEMTQIMSAILRELSRLTELSCKPVDVREILQRK